MAAKSRQPLVGERLNSVIIQPLKKSNAGGTLADAALTGAGGTLGDTVTTYLGFALVDGAAFTGHVEDVEFDEEFETEDGTLLGQTHSGEVLGPLRVTCTLTEILRYRSWNSGATVRIGNFLFNAFNNTIANSDSDDAGARDVLVTIRRAGELITFYGQMRSYRESYRARKAVGVMTITCADPGLALSESLKVQTYTQNSGTAGT